jgi:hypothetical protein
MLTTRLIVQYIGQSVGLVILRIKAPRAPRGYRVPLYPLPVVINILGFGFVFATTSNWFFYKQAPLLEIGILTLIVGGLLYLPFAKVNKFWPFEPTEPTVVTHEASANSDLVPSSSALESALMVDCDDLGAVELTSLELEVTTYQQLAGIGGSCASTHPHNYACAAMLVGDSSVSGLIQQKR